MTSSARLAALAAALLGCAGADDGEAADGQELVAPSRCVVSSWTGAIACSHQTLSVDGRRVGYQTPLGAPPPGGWPVVFFFQGSFFPAELAWSAAPNSALEIFGAVAQTTTVKLLLDGGYAVIAPTAALDGFWAWDTNLPPWDLLWTLAPDHHLMLDLFAALRAGTFGPISTTRWYATGVSSGGYMTSRVGVAYPGRFRALAIAAGSYATCGGPVCVVPHLDGDHPPTLFLHGGLDPVVPAWTMYLYQAELAYLGVDNEAIVNPTFLHGWIPQAPPAVLAWFNRHP
jgi:hypothetical protein